MKKKKSNIYKFGGFTPTEGLTNGTEAAAGAVGALTSMFSKPNKYGRESGLASGLQKGAQFASMGAKVGGPWGAAAGAAIGLGAGLIGSVKAKRKEDGMDMKADSEEINLSQMRGLNSMAARPEDYDGSSASQFFKYGGKMEGMSEDSVEVQGPSHEEGGVQLPNGAEVEGGETISGNYVFSEELGFAKQHKPIAKAIGKLEKKQESTIRKNTLHALQEREQGLALQQETVKQLLGL